MNINGTVSDGDMSGHMTFWLDKHIGDPDFSQHIKLAFSTNSNPKNKFPVELFRKDSE